MSSLSVVNTTPPTPPATSNMERASRLFQSFDDNKLSYKYLDNRILNHFQLVKTE